MSLAAVLCTIKATEIIDDYCKDCELSQVGKIPQQPRDKFFFATQCMTAAWPWIAFSGSVKQNHSFQRNVWSPSQFLKLIFLTIAVLLNSTQMFPALYFFYFSFCNRTIKGGS